MTTPLIQTLTDELLGEIEAAAMNATQDDWELIPGTKLSGPEVVANGEPIAWVLNSEADAVHIQMANPAMVLALITELRTLRAENEALLNHSRRIIEQLRAENAELRKDAGRYEAAYNAVIDYMLGAGYCEEPLNFLHCWNEGDFDCLRDNWPEAPIAIYYADSQADHEAIDQAMEQAK